MNKQQFTKQVLEAEASLYHVAHTLLVNEEDCADAIQNAILAAYDKLGDLKKDAYFKTWLTRILINECYRILRVDRHHLSFEELEEDNTLQPLEKVPASRNNGCWSRTVKCTGRCWSWNFPTGCPLSCIMWRGTP